MAPTIYGYPSLDTNYSFGEAAGGKKTMLPGATGNAVTERPDKK